jgi:hypothetical protein
VKVTDSAGETWRVKRRWLPWRRRVRDVPDVPAGDFFMAGGDDPISAILAVIGLVILLPVIVIFAVMVAELLLLLLLLPLWLVARAMLGGSWPIEVARGRSIVHVEAVKGWSASRERLMELAEAARLGRPSGAFDPGASSSA